MGNHEMTDAARAAAMQPPLELDALFAQTYAELREIAHLRLRHHRRADTLGTTALVHEAFLRLSGPSGRGLQDRAHFLALASRAMRFVLVDYARSRSAGKRGGAAPNLALDAVQVAAESPADDLLALNEALERLGSLDARLARVIEHRFFGGLTFEEIATITGQSVPTVKRDWARARAWLQQALTEAERAT